MRQVGPCSRLRAVLRHRPFLQTMHRLALMGALLMAVAPVLSRWVQSHQDAGPLHQVAALCTSGGMQLVELGPAGPTMSHAGHATDMVVGMAMGMAGMEHGDAGGMPADHHDGMACDYCLLAARLLPLGLALLLLPLLQAAPALRPVHRALPRLAIAWPAHAARGPPLRA